MLIEDYDEDTGEAIGRSYRESPESDGEIRVANCDTPTGRSVPVLITATSGVDLLGEVTTP